MSKELEAVLAAQERAIAGRPQIGGFLYVAEVLRRAGITQNLWVLPACQSLYLTESGAVVMQGQPLTTVPVEVPAFDSEALIRALRTDQIGESTFPEFLNSAWNAGVVRYTVDFLARKVTYYGCRGEHYAESYREVIVD